MAFLQRLQKDIPSEEIKTGEEDDDDNGDNLLKDSNDSESVIYLSHGQCTSNSLITVDKSTSEPGSDRLHLLKIKCPTSQNISSQ